MVFNDRSLTNEKDGLSNSLNLTNQGQVVRRPGLTEALRSLVEKFFFISYVWCSLRLLHLKTEGQTI